MAQFVERWHINLEVAGSNPTLVNLSLFIPNNRFYCISAKMLYPQNANKLNYKQLLLVLFHECNKVLSNTIDFMCRSGNLRKIL